MHSEKQFNSVQSTAAQAAPPNKAAARRMAKHPARHQRRSKKKPVLMGIVFAAVFVVALGRALAWSDFTQSQVNRLPGIIDADVTLHDEFDGTDKDVFVENSGSNTLYVRIRLDEFMQIGDVKFEPTADASDPTTWTPHTYTGTTPEDCGNISTAAANGEIYLFHNYYAWDMNGLDRPYTPGTPGMVYTKLGSDDNVYPVDETRQGHNTAASNPPVLLSTFLHIKALVDADTTLSQADASAWERIVTGCWVLDDTDEPKNGGGWAYWSVPLEAGTATNLLLDEVEMITRPDEDWIYLIDVKMQAVTANDFSKWHDAASTTGYRVTAGALELQNWWHTAFNTILTPIAQSTRIADSSSVQSISVSTQSTSEYSQSTSVSTQSESEVTPASSVNQTPDTSA